MAQSKFKYAVIEFTDEEAVEVTSTKWLSEDKRSCYWPNCFGKKLTKLLVNHFDPLKDIDRSVIWQVYECRVFGIYDTIEIARSKRNDAQFTSNLESGTEESFTPSQRPKFRNQVTTTKTLPPPASGSSEESSPEDSGAAASQPFTLQQLPHKAKGPSLILNSPSNLDDTHVNRTTPATRPFLIADSTPKPSSSSTNLRSLYQTLQNIQQLLDAERKNNECFQEKVIGRLVTIKTGLAELLLRTSKQDTVSFEDIGISIPVSSLEQFSTLREWLNDEDNFKSLTIRLAVFGGKDPREITNRILDQLLCKSVATQLSLTGKGKKSLDGLRNTSVIKLLFESVRRTKGGEATTNAEIEDYIKRYLKNVGGKGGKASEEQQI